jgi:cell division protein FtsZ
VPFYNNKHSSDSFLQLKNFTPKIVVIGVGGAGLNAVNNMILSKLTDVKFIVANTDCQSLGYSLSENKIQLGIECTKGLGAGAIPDVGKMAAEEAKDEIRSLLEGADMLFIASGMGGGTGTGASPVIAEIAKSMGILTVGVVTKPFSFEGPRRMQVANNGVEILERIVDTLIVVSNQNLLRLANDNTGFAEGFKMADDVLYNSVRCVVELLTKPGFINRDFADLRTIIASMGRAMIGYGEASGENRKMLAAENAITNPILENGSIEGATSVLVNVTGGKNLRLLEVEEIVNKIRGHLSIDANVIFGTVFDEAMDDLDIIRVAIVATGMTNKSTSENHQNIQQNNNAIEKIQIPEKEQKPSETTHQQPLGNPNFDNNSFSEDDIIPTEETFQSSISASREEYLKTALNEISNGGVFNNNGKNEVKKKSQFFGNNNESSVKQKNYLPLFNASNTIVKAAYSKIRKAVIEDKQAIQESEKPTISEWNESKDEEDNFSKDIWNIPAISRSA